MLPSLLVSCVFMLFTHVYVHTRLCVHISSADFFFFFLHSKNEIICTAYAQAAGVV